MPNETTMRNTSIADDTQAIRDKARELGESTMDAARSVGAKIQGASAAAADGLSSATDAASERIRSTTDYLRNNDMNRMRSDVETMVKNNPGPAILVAAAFGFLLGRALTRE